MTERIVDTLEAFQALESAVAKMGRDYVEPGGTKLDPSNPAHWFAYRENIVDDEATQYGCLLGHWMGELGLTTAQADEGHMPNTWELHDGKISAASEVRVSPQVANMLGNVPDMNDDGYTWGHIIDTIRANSIVNAPDLTTAALETAVPR